MTKTHKHLQILLSVFFPKRCIFCGNILPASSFGCEECSKKLPFIEDGVCGHCRQKEKSCRCLIQEYQKVIAPFYYENIVKRAILSFKFYGRNTAGKDMAKYMCDVIHEKYRDIQFDKITCVPLSKTELKERGFNQSAILCRYIAKELQIPYDTELLKKVREIDPQRTKKAHERKGNVLGAFDVANNEMLKNTTILLIDDVMTTGSTLNECAKMLSIYGAKQIYCAVFAMTKMEAKKKATNL